MAAIHYRLLGYSVTLVMHVITFYDVIARLQVTTKDPVVEDFARLQGRFITIWTFLLQIAYILLGLACDLPTIFSEEDSPTSKPLNSAREIWFAALIWPTSLLVPAIFWPLYLTDSSLVFPPFINQILSRANNHVLHTAIAPVVLWELVFLPRSEGNHWRNIKILVVYSIGYLVCLLGSYLQRGTWLYPVLGRVYGTIYFPLFFLAVVGLLTFFYCIQWPLTRLVWGAEEKEKKSH